MAEAQTELIQLYERRTQSVDVLPFEGIHGLPIDDIYVPLKIEEDLQAKQVSSILSGSSSKELKRMRELFKIDGEEAERIFMKAEAGCGKTLFCLKMLDCWLQVKKSGNDSNVELKRCLADFDLVFYLPLRDFKGVSSVNDMLSKMYPNLLVSESHCLIILDGLDEVGYNELPSMSGVNVSYVLFCTMRPWTLNQLRLKFGKKDKVVQIAGLLPSHEGKVIENILRKYYKIESEEEFSEKFDKYSSMMKNCAPLMKIPMMLTTCCCMWCHNDKYLESKDRDGNTTTDSPDVYSSITHTYLSLVDVMITRAGEKSELQSLGVLNALTTVDHHAISVNILEKFPKIKGYINPLLQLCQIAYNDMASDKTTLVFQEDELPKGLVQLGLKSGLISERQAPGLFHQKNVSFNFYHKTVQEFMAAIHLTCRDTDDIRNICKSVDKVLYVANIITFVMGLDPSFCPDISKPVADIIKKETLDDKDSARQIFRTQCQWYEELRHGQNMTGDRSPPPILHVSGVYLDLDSDIGTVNMTKGLIFKNLDRIVCVWLWAVRHTLDRIIWYLPKCHVLSALYIRHIKDIKDHDNLVAVLPELASLETLVYHGRERSTFVAAQAVNAIMKVKQLKRIELWVLDLTGKDVPNADDDMDMVFTYDNVELLMKEGDVGVVYNGPDKGGVMAVDKGNPLWCGVLVTPDMTRLEKMVFGFVYMSPKAWERFVDSLLTIQQTVDIRLHETDIDQGSVARIKLPKFRVNNKKRTDTGRRHKLLEFTVLPTTLYQR